MALSFPKAVQPLMLRLRESRPCLDNLNATQPVTPTQHGNSATSGTSLRGDAIQSS